MNRRFSIITILVFISSIVFLSGCQTKPPAEVELQPKLPLLSGQQKLQLNNQQKYHQQRTPIPVPTSTETPIILNGSDQPIKIQDYSLVIAYNGLIDIGYNPTGDKITTALSFGVTEENGKLKEVIALGVLVTDRLGAWINTSMSETGTNFKGEETLTYNIFATETKGEYFLLFPGGEMIDLTPLIK